MAPLFVFGQQHLPTRETTEELPETMRGFHYGWALDSFLERRGFSGWLTGIVDAVWTLWDLRMLLTVLPLVTIGWWGRFRLTRWLAAAIVVQILVSASVCWIFLHYLAPLVPWLVVLSVLGLRRVFRMFVKVLWVRQSRPQRFVGCLLAVQCVLLVVHGLRVDNSVGAWARRRASIVRELETCPGQHLVLVRYAADHNVHQEWVYNLADLDGSKVLWARGERNDWNTRLFDKYLPTHTIWELEPDRPDSRPKLVLPSATK